MQNIGGIGNVTFLPPRGSSTPSLAFDTGPGNALIDWAAAYATEGALAFDEAGKLAARGRCDDELVARWLSHPYFRQQPPKSTGRELFSHALAEQYRQEADTAGLSALDFVATLTGLTAASIADSYHRFAPLPVSELIVCGGGAHNPTLLTRIREQLSRRRGQRVPVVRYGDVAGVPGDEDSKEALCFALLAWLTMQGAAGNVPACTGAAGPRVLGKIAPGRNFRQLVRKLGEVLGARASRPHDEYSREITGGSLQALFFRRWSLAVASMSYPSDTIGLVEFSSVSIWLG